MSLNAIIGPPETLYVNHFLQHSGKCCTTKGKEEKTTLFFPSSALHRTGTIFPSYMHGLKQPRAAAAAAAAAAPVTTRGKGGKSVANQAINAKLAFLGNGVSLVEWKN